MRHTFVIALAALAFFLLPATAQADEVRCQERFPDADWSTVDVDALVTVATAGMTEEMGARFGRDVARVSQMVQDEIGGMAGTSVCLATPAFSDAFADLVAPGQRLHVGIFAQEKIMALSAVETRMIDDSIAYGLPQIALWQLGEELGLEGGYPEPLGSTIAHWYLARDTNRLERYRTELLVTIFLDDVNPEDRTAADAMPWVSDRKLDPSFFDPQFAGSQMGVFIDFAVAEEGTEILRQPEQAVWADLENRWRVSIRDEFPRGDFGVWWGVGIVVTFVSLAILLAWTKRRQNRKASQRRPIPPVDESLFTSGVEE